MVPHRVTAQQLKGFAIAACEAVGTPGDVAHDVADVLVAADARGTTSHGTARLPAYVDMVTAGVMDPAGLPTTVTKRGNVTVIDGNNGWGHHAGRVAIDAAVAAARTDGIGFSVVRNSNHYGIAAWYSLRAAGEGMVGISCSSSHATVAPTRSSEALLGTNPLSVAAPAGQMGTFCLDMATSVVPRGRIEVAARKGAAIPSGWAIDSEGRPVTNAQRALEGSILPLGGTETTGGYKGYGLSVAVEVLTTFLGGGSFPRRVDGVFDLERPAGLCHTHVAVNPEALGVSTEDAAEAFAGFLSGLTTAPVVPGSPGRVLMHGEPETLNAIASQREGIELDASHSLSLTELASSLSLGHHLLGDSASAGSDQQVLN